MLSRRCNPLAILALIVPIPSLASPVLLGATSPASTLTSMVATSPASTFNVTSGGAAYPRANYLSNGDILGAYTAFSPDGQQVLTIVTSSDNGGSWRLTGTAARKPVKSGSLDNAFPLQLPSGRLLLAYRNHDVTDNGTPTAYRITISCSDNNGVSWKYLTDAVVVIATPSNNGVWEPFLRNTQSGVLQLYYSHERSATDQDSVVLTSLDGGVTWGDEKIISGVTQTSSRDGMVGIAEMGGSSLVAIFETNENGGPFSLAMVTSADDGATWDNRQSLYVAAPGKNAGAPQIAKVGETLVVSFMTNEDYPVVPNVSWVEMADAKLLMSTDGGVSWSKTTVFNAPAFWPGLMPLKDQKSFLYLAGAKGLKSQTFVLS